MLTIREMKLPDNKYPRKATYPMQPIGIVIHNTWNYAPAINEVSYMQTNDAWLSFHFAVDELEAIQCLPLDRSSWNAGDGTYGPGNRKYISIEICRSRSSLKFFEPSEKNGAILTALLLKKYGWDISRVKKHQDFSGKYCPHRTLDLGWKRFVKMVQAELDKLNQPPTIAETSNSKVEPGFVGTFKYTGPKGNIRRDSTIRSDVIGNLYRNSTRDIAYIKNGWGKLKYQSGWVSMKILEEVVKKKSNEEIAKEVINGQWGNGLERKTKLESAGYDYYAVQKKVNEIL